MKKIEVAVTAHAGYRGGEYPCSFTVARRNIAVAGIKSQWIGQDAEGRDRMRFFRVQGSDGGMYLLSYDEMTGEWYLENSSDRGIHG